MFGDLMNQMQEMQAEMRRKLAEATFTGEAQDGAIQVSCDGTRQVTNISIDAEKIDLSDPEALEDLLLVAVNRALEQAAAFEAEQGQAAMGNMLPGGMEGLLG
ncbi:MAG: YbaB/EbfC family nucleoid-associated protein [Bacteroidota bacterium]